MDLGTRFVIADAGDVIEDSLFLALDSEPFDVFAGTRTRAFADVAEAIGSEFGSFKAGIEEAAHDVVGEKFHAAIGVMDDEEFARTEEFVADDEGTYDRPACRSHQRTM
jgi:hypothetical protein